MRFTSPHRRRLLCTAISLSLLPIATQTLAQCSGQLIPDSELDRFSALAGGMPSLKACGRIQL